jgi:hypothetical protein
MLIIESIHAGIKERYRARVIHLMRILLGILNVRLWNRCLMIFLLLHALYLWIAIILLSWIFKVIRSIFSGRFSMHFIFIIFMLFYLLMVWIIIRFRRLPSSFHIKGAMRSISGMSKLYQLFVVASLIVRRHLIIRLLLLLIHVRPLWADMAHNIVWRPFRMEFLKLFAVLLAEVYISRERFLRSWMIPLCSYIRT